MTQEDRPMTPAAQTSPGEMFTCAVCGDPCRLVHRYPDGVVPPERTTHSAVIALAAPAHSEPDAEAAIALSTVADELVPGIRHDFGIEAEPRLAARGYRLVRASEADRGAGLARYRDVLDPANGPKYRSGACVEEGCPDKAGTAWSPVWCPRHNAERMQRIDQSFDALAASQPAEREETGE